MSGPTGMMMFDGMSFGEWAQEQDANGDGLTFRELVDGISSILPRLIATAEANKDAINSGQSPEWMPCMDSGCESGLNCGAMSGEAAEGDFGFGLCVQSQYCGQSFGAKVLECTENKESSDAQGTDRDSGDDRRGGRRDGPFADIDWDEPRDRVIMTGSDGSMMIMISGAIKLAAASALTAFMTLY